MEYLPLLPASCSSYLPTNSCVFFQGVGMNQDMRVFSQPMQLALPDGIVWSSGGIIPFGLGTDWSFTLRPGDSSNPARLLVGDKLILVAHNEGVPGGPNYAYWIAGINQAMHYLSTNNNVGTDYQLTLFSLTDWPALAAP